MVYTQQHQQGRSLTRNFGKSEQSKIRKKNEIANNKCLMQIIVSKAKSTGEMDSALD